MLERHREEDKRVIEPDLHAKEVQRIASLERDAVQMRQWMAANPEDRKNKAKIKIGHAKITTKGTAKPPAPASPYPVNTALTKQAKL